LNPDISCDKIVVLLFARWREGFILSFFRGGQEVAESTPKAGNPKVYLVDVTNRDGVQTSRICLAKLQKTMLNVMLNRMGVARSEFGFPFTLHETNYLNANLELHDLGELKPILLSGWCTMRPQDIERSFTLVPKLKHMNISLSTSDIMIKGKFSGGKTREEVAKMMLTALKMVKDKGVSFVGVNAEDASRTDIKFLIEFACAAKEHGANSIRYCDTLGYDDPDSIYKRIRHLADAVKIPIELHCHNDLGMAVACSCAGAVGAVDAGVDAYINTTVNGMGERAGNADMVSCILALRKSSGWGKRDLLDERVDLSHAWRVCKYASYAFGVPIPINQPGVGANAFAHESGIHADGALKDRRNYELYDYEELGRGEPEIVETGRNITVGEYSGIKGFRNVYDGLMVEFKDDAQATEILELVRYANVHTQKPLTQEELRFIAKYPKQARKILTVTPP
jgi:isopropylmalate/homocitrate/citramalate synthase